MIAFEAYIRYNFCSLAMTSAQARRSMELVYNILIIVMVLLNVLSFVLYGLDKIKAVNDAWRIPEKRLLWASAMGPFGGWLGMRIFRHKVKKPRFYVGIPFFAFIQLLIVAIVIWATW